MDEQKNNNINYMRDRFEGQLDYFEKNALKNQFRYRLLKYFTIISTLLTSISIALIFVVPFSTRTIVTFLALIFSIFIMVSYQIEEFQNYGAKWEKFRLVAEQLKSEKWLYLNNTGRYAPNNTIEPDKLFIETIEGIIKGTDISYFLLMVEPGKRLEKRLQNNKLEV